MAIQAENFNVDVRGEFRRNLQVHSGLNAPSSCGKRSWRENPLTIAHSMVAFQPGLGAQELVLRHKEDNVLGPIDLWSEKLGNAEKDGDASVSVLVWRVGRPVRSAQHQSLRAGGLWGPEDGVHIGPSEVPALRQWVG